MAKVDPFSAFRLEDFPTQRDWIDTLFLPLNLILAQVSQAMGGQVTFGDNIPSITRTLSGTNLTLPQSFKVDGGFTPGQMTVGQAVKDGVPVCMVGAWSQSGDTLTVSKLFEVSDSGMTAVAAGPKYSITLRFT